MSGISQALTAALAHRYTILRQIGQGGMATVYEAEDVRHERKVALKVLRPELAAVVGADRFLKEVKTTANLQHPHILPLHDSGDANGSVFYVMPFVEGESLRDRLLREKQLPVEEAVRIAREVLSALHYAHRHGVVHRDIKPENILLHDGQALVADFGIALAVSSAGADTRMTETGMSLGTPHYMSPEQAMGERDVTGRSDVYAMGCVLYEMLLGEPPFTGPTAQAIIARVITEEPRRMLAQRKTVPPNVEGAVLKALAKLPADRFANAADFSDALARTEPPAPVSTPAVIQRVPAGAAAARQPVVLASLAIAALSISVAAWAVSRGETNAGQPLIRFDVSHSASDRMIESYQPLAVSPDGQTIAMTASRDGATQVYIRRVGDNATRPVAGTGGAAGVTFLPDGNWIAFSRGAALYKVPIAGGTPSKVADVPWNQATASWAPDGSILVGSASSISLYRLARENGPLEELTQPDTTSGELNHRYPRALPDGRHVLFEVGREDGSHPALLSLSSGEWHDLGLGVANATVYSAGHLVYIQANRVMAAAFDLRRGRVTGTPAIVESVGSAGGEAAQIWALAASPNGTVVHASGPGGAQDLELVWVERSGSATPTGFSFRSGFDQPRLSPDGAVIAAQGLLGTLDVIRVRTGGRTRLARPQAQMPEWSPDGRLVAYGDGGSGLWLVAADGRSAPERIVASRLWPYSWSPDGTAIAVYEVDEATGRNIQMVRREGETWTATPFIATNANERSPAISPDGRWLAYASDESGQDEIYVTSFPGGQGRWLVSQGGGREPAWSGNGRELFYRRGNEYFSAAVASGPAFDAEAPVRLFSFEADVTPGPTGERDWDVTRDGRRFLFMRSPLAASPFTLRVVMNFPAALAQSSR